MYCNSMNENDRIADLTVEELRTLIRQTVQEAMAEVLIEFSLAAEYDAELAYQAEMTDLLRSSLQERHPGLMPVVNGVSVFDD
jgi:uncharacterized protein YdhG (YjbR/CyaY superfamily)